MYRPEYAPRVSVNLKLENLEDGFWRVRIAGLHHTAIVLEKVGGGVDDGILISGKEYRYIKQGWRMASGGYLSKRKYHKRREYDCRCAEIWKIHEEV